MTAYPPDPPDAPPPGWFEDDEDRDDVEAGELVEWPGGLPEDDLRGQDR